MPQFSSSLPGDLSAAPYYLVMSYPGYYTGQANTLNSFPSGKDKALALQMLMTSIEQDLLLSNDMTDDMLLAYLQVMDMLEDKKGGGL